MSVEFKSRVSKDSVTQLLLLLFGVLSIEYYIILSHRWLCNQRVQLYADNYMCATDYIYHTT